MNLEELISTADSLSVKLRVAYTFHCEGVESPQYCLQVIARELSEVASDISVLAEKKSDSTGRVEPRKGYFGGTQDDWERNLREAGGEASQDFP